MVLKKGKYFLNIPFYLFEDLRNIERPYTSKSILGVDIDFCRKRQFTEIPNMSQIVIWKRIFTSISETVYMPQLVSRYLSAIRNGV